MNSPHCATIVPKKRTKKTKLGYAPFFCPKSRSTFNSLEFPTDMVLLAVIWRLRYKLSLRDGAEVFLARGFQFTHEAIRDWEARFASWLTNQLRSKRYGQGGTSWYVDETSLKVPGKWGYFYRAIDHGGTLVDSRLSKKRNREAAQQFFKQAVAVVGHTPKSVTTEGHRSYPRAISEIMGDNRQHRTNKYLNNRLEQDHRGIKQRSYPMRGFGTFASAARFCRAFDEVRQFFRVRTAVKQKVSLAQQREVFRQRLDMLKAFALGM